MSDITIKYGSTGFEKVARELSELEKRAGGAANWFAPMQKSLKDVEGGSESFFSKFSAGLEKIKMPLASFAADLIKVSGAIGALAIAVGGTVTYAFEKWTMSVLKTTESFRMLEISMYGATKSWEAVATASKFAKEYAAEYPAMYGDIMRALQSFAYIPALRPMIQRGDVQNMKEMMHIVQGMMTIRPEQGVTGAIYALREALAGNWRSLMYRFDIPIASIAEAAGMTLEQMKQSPEQAIKALKSWIDEFVGAETMAMMAKNLSIQVGNLKDKYEMWLDRLGKTGVYEKVVNYLLKLNEFLDNLLKSERLKEWTEKIGAFLGVIVDKIAAIFTKGIDWEKVISLSDLMAALKKVGENAIKAFKEIWEMIKDPMAKVFQSVFRTMAEMIMPVIKEIFYPIGKEMAKQVALGFIDFLREHPEIGALMLGYKGAMLGSQMGGMWGGVIGGSAGALVALIPWLSEKLGVGIGAKPTKEAGDVFDQFLKNLENLVKSVETTVGGGGGVVATTTKRLSVEEMEKLRELREKQEWSYYQQWSRMGMMMAQAPETAGPRATPFQRYARGELTWEQMLAAEKVERFQEQQLSKLEEMAAFAQKQGDFGYLSKIYGEMFDVSYRRGDFGKAQEYMNASLDAMVKAMEEEKANMQKELGLLGGIERNTGDSIDLLRQIEFTLQGMKITYSPIGREEEWSQDELRYQVKRALGEA